MNAGMGLGNRDNFAFLSAGFQLGKPLTPVFHAGIFSGQFEFSGNVMPLWQSYTPAPHEELYTCGTPSGRRNLLSPCRWWHLQGNQHNAGDTALEFSYQVAPHSALVPGRRRTDLYHAQVSAEPAECHGVNGGTSVWNFSPQGGVGFHYFTRDKRSIDIGVNGVHISSASLGDRNPGVNASVQVQVGYTFWK